MKTKIFYSLLLAGLPWTMQAQVLPDSMTIKEMETECNAFLDGMPAGLQDRQAEAIEQAMKGNRQALLNIRNGRNVPPKLPTEVNADYITPRICVYSPRKASNKPRPLLLYLHGGGWTFGSINSCAEFCAAVALEADCFVAALDYQLAPEHPFPAALNDCSTTYAYLRRHSEELGWDRNRIFIGGDSAGGNLTLALGLKLSGIKGLIPIYPVTKLFTEETDSWTRFNKGYGCDAHLLEVFNRAYAHDEVKNPLVSVALAPDSVIARLPQTLFISAGRDILLDQGKEFVERMEKMKVDVDYHVFPTATHLFITVPGQRTAFERAVKLTADFIRKE